MASVNIPFGGSTVTVDVPDFAMEGTQQDVLEQASRQTDALQKIAQSMGISIQNDRQETCLLYTSPSPRDQRGSRMPSSA